MVDYTSSGCDIHSGLDEAVPTPNGCAIFANIYDKWYSSVVYFP